jgi:phosphoglycerate kinase
MDDVPLDGKVALLRVDFNVPVGSDGKVDAYEDYRIEAAISTIQELQQRRCKILLLTHMGKGNSETDWLAIHRRLEELLHEEVKRAKHLYGADVEALVAGLEPGSAVLLPNVRSDDREKHPTRHFAEQLAGQAELYINEAFSVCHRDHASVVMVPELLPACAGRRLVTEVEVLAHLREAPKRPYVAIISGAKIATKVRLLQDLLPRVDAVCLGGQLANIVLAAQGKYQAQPFEASDIAHATQLLSEGGEKIVVPADVVVGSVEGTGDDSRTLRVEDLTPTSGLIWDIGPQSTAAIISRCQSAATVMWNGPVGRYELPPYDRATREIAQALSQQPAYRVVGGGDTVNVLEELRLTQTYDHVSVGGGAMVAFLEAGTLPGLEPLYAP